MSRRPFLEIARATLAAGLAGGAAMVPAGLLVRASGGDVNVYGELTARLLFGSASPLALLVVHVAVSVTLAAPLAALAVHARVASWTLGFAWAVAAWILLNLWILPAAFDRSPAWTGGVLAIWPGFAVHAVYGLVVGGTLRRVASRPRGLSATPPARLHEERVDDRAESPRGATRGRRPRKLSDDPPLREGNANSPDK